MFILFWLIQTHISFFLFLFIWQHPVVVMVSPPMRSYFQSTTKKVWSRLKASWKTHPRPFIGTQVVARHLVEDTRLKLLTMPIVTLTLTQTLAVIILSQVECKTRAQSWLETTTSHLMRWKCFILAESHRLKTNTKPPAHILIFTLCHGCS